MEVAPDNRSSSAQSIPDFSVSNISLISTIRFVNACLLSERAHYIKFLRFIPFLLLDTDRFDV